MAEEELGDEDMKSMFEKAFVDMSEGKERAKAIY